MWLGRIIFIVVCLIAGVSLIVLGAKLQNGTAEPTLSRVSLSFGGTILGVVATLLLGYLKQFDLIDILRGSLEAKFITEDEKLTTVKRKFYKYHLTEGKKGWQWKCAVIDFSNSLLVGSLETSISEIDDDGRPYPGTISAGLRDDRLVLFHKAASGEQMIVYIFPYFGKGITRIHSGVGFMESWKINPIVTKVLISLDPIGSHKETGEVSTDAAKKCDDIWREQFKEKNNFSALAQSQDELNANN